MCHHCCLYLTNAGINPLQLTKLTHRLAHESIDGLLSRRKSTRADILPRGLQADGCGWEGVVEKSGQRRHNRYCKQWTCWLSTHPVLICCMVGLEHKLEQMSERLKEISKEIEHARKQEIAMKQSSGEYVHSQSIHIACPPDDQSLSAKLTSESTSSSVQWFSILSIIILVSTSVWQIIYLRSFFTAKKLL